MSMAKAFDEIFNGNPAEKLLYELVACKDLKDKIDGMKRQAGWQSDYKAIDALDAEYQARKIAAWAAARELVKPPAPVQPQPNCPFCDTKPEPYRVSGFRGITDKVRCVNTNCDIFNVPIEPRHWSNLNTVDTRSMQHMNEAYRRLKDQLDAYNNVLGNFIALTPVAIHGTVLDAATLVYDNIAARMEQSRFFSQDIEHFERVTEATALKLFGKIPDGVASHRLLALCADHFEARMQDYARVCGENKKYSKSVAMLNDQVKNLTERLAVFTNKAFDKGVRRFIDLFTNNGWSPPTEIHLDAETYDNALRSINVKPELHADYCFLYGLRTVRGL